MKLHAHTDHVDYHPIAPYVKVTVDCGRTELKKVISFNTFTGEYECYTDPIHIVNEMCEVFKGQSDSLSFEIDADAPSAIMHSWYDRELTQRKLNEH